MPLWTAGITNGPRSTAPAIRFGREADAPGPGHPCYDGVIYEGEIKLGMVRRHVGARLIAKQRTLIARLRQREYIN